MRVLFQFIAYLVCVMVMVGCATPRPTISNTSCSETKYSNEKSHVESVIDSTIIDRLREVIYRNDTVYIRDSIYIEKWRDRHVTDTVRDTLYIEKIDTITNTVEVEIEKPIAPFVIKSCIALWVIVGVAILAIVAWVWFNFATGKFSWAKILSKLIK